MSAGAGHRPVVARGLIPLLLELGVLGHGEQKVDEMRWVGALASCRELVGRGLGVA